MTREDCRGHEGRFIPSADNPEACAICCTLNRAATMRLLDTLMPGDDDPSDEEPR